ncbi:MAG: glycine zipper 2TM domain-containing protein [Burkholderiales bacterium]|nr:MAG: glycine zipper 2TM domain-containing protein [Burkholderiales bacterium]
MMTRIRKAALAAAMGLLGATAGCSTWDGLSSRDKATVGGAAAGGVVGNVIGGGALGTVGGAAVGGVIGNQVGKERERR